MTRWDGHLNQLIDKARAGGGDDDCWPWQGNVNTTHGYGRYGQESAHRAVYLLLVGPIPDGLHLDHECHNRDASCPGGSRCLHRLCVNPSHLIPRTSGDNLRRGKFRRVTCGKCGRVYDLLQRNSDGTAWRRCKHCTYAANQRSRARHRRASTT